MAKINTLNYQTVAAWNGSQDLFVVEQSDGTKVATPAMVKQFIEAGDFEATGEIEDGHGNILKDMAKSADMDAEIGDLSQTGLTGDSVAEQLGDAKGRIANVNTAVARLSGNYSTTLYTDFNDLPHGSIVQLMGSVPHSPGYTSRYYVVFTYFIAGTTTYRLQFAIENGSGDIFTRNCTNGTWGNWTKFATT